MLKMKTISILTVAALMLASTAQAANVFSGSGDGFWNTATNWSFGVVPGNPTVETSTTIGIYAGVSATIQTDAPDASGLVTKVKNGSNLTINADLTNSSLEIATGGTVTVNDGGTLAITAKTLIPSGTFYMKGGTNTMGDDLEVGAGSVLEFSGGSFTSSAELELKGGTVKVVGYDAAGLLSFHGMKDGASGAIFEYVPNAAGQITAITMTLANEVPGSDKGLVVNLDALTAASTMTLIKAGTFAQAEFSSIAITKDATPLTLGTEGALTAGQYYLDYAGGTGNNDVVLSVNPVPEPATMSLLAIGGLGLLLMRRRRRA